VHSDSSDIVIRDKNGEFEIGDPPTPPLDDPDDEGALDDIQENQRKHHLARSFLKIQLVEESNMCLQ
jgi:hypothetical protein